MSETLRRHAPKGLINPDGGVNGTIAHHVDAEIGGEPVRLAAFYPDFPKQNKPNGRQDDLSAFIDRAEPVYVKADALEDFMYESSVTVTHDSGCESPEESAILLLEWLRTELTWGETRVHVNVAGQDGYTYSVAVTKDEAGTLVAKSEGVWKGGMR